MTAVNIRYDDTILIKTTKLSCILFKAIKYAHRASSAVKKPLTISATQPFAERDLSSFLIDGVKLIIERNATTGRFRTIRAVVPDTSLIPIFSRIGEIPRRSYVKRANIIKHLLIYPSFVPW